MFINELLNAIDINWIQQNEKDIQITDIVYDSRKVTPGCMFVCIQGERFDGHDYIEVAFEKGANIVVIEKEVPIVNKGVNVIKVDDSTAFLALVASTYYNNPSKKMNMVGITGTNGKTSVSYLISEIMKKSGRSTGVIGTIGFELDGKPLDVEKNTPTTPNSLELQMILDKMYKQKATDVVMEVTSIALDKQRVNECEFDIGIFTNLTEDHLDYHKNMENYELAKEKLFHISRKAVINVDDEAGKRLAASYTGPKITYSIDNESDLQAKNIHLSPSKTEFELGVNGEVYKVSLRMPGKFNVYNALAAIGASLMAGVGINTILGGLTRIQGVRGRFEACEMEGGYTAVVDYAHTPDALANVLNTAREFKPNRLITVFGCGGDRDATKRPIMGKISGELSDISVITSDNPRNEDPNKILRDVEKGLENTNAIYKIISDRRDAIEYALAIAEQDDIVMVAGKGHETYQILKNKTIHFDDLEIIKEFDAK